MEIPNLALNGEDKSPALVVAPTKVNGGRGIFNTWLDPFWLTNIERLKSSIAP